MLFYCVVSYAHSQDRGKLSNPKDNSECCLRTAREMKPSCLSQREKSQRQTKFFSMLRVWDKKTTTTEFPKGIAAMTFRTPVPGGGVLPIPCSGLYGEAPPERGAFLKLAYTEG